MAKSDTLFVTEAQIAERLGVSTDLLKTALPALQKSGFPAPDPLFQNRRYWPAVKAWLDRRYHLDKVDGVTAPPGLDGVEHWES